MFAAEIFPIVRALVDDFEEPPGRSGKDEQHDEIAAGPREQGRAAAGQNERIDSENVAEPERKKQKGGAEARQQPVQGPKDGNEDKSQNAVPGLQELLFWPRRRHSM